MDQDSQTIQTKELLKPPKNLKKISEPEDQSSKPTDNNPPQTPNEDDKVSLKDGRKLTNYC
jgi:hypothetical protein